MERRLLAGDRWTRAALAAAMLAPLVVGSIVHDKTVWIIAMFVVVGLAGWAVIRAPRPRVIVLAVLIVGIWAWAFWVSADEGTGGPHGPVLPTETPTLAP